MRVERWNGLSLAALWRVKPWRLSPTGTWTRDNESWSGNGGAGSAPDANEDI